MCLLCLNEKDTRRLAPDDGTSHRSLIAALRRKSSSLKPAIDLSAVPLSTICPPTCSSKSGRGGRTQVTFSSSRCFSFTGLQVVSRQIRGPNTFTPEMTCDQDCLWSLSLTCPVVSDRGWTHKLSPHHECCFKIANRKQIEAFFCISSLFEFSTLLPPNSIPFVALT